ncbi:hypothetical protein [Kibdelosporangium aridum]|uniref:Peptide/nickel transport system ATP-binding protein n=1 Tax=Kibdelosporangium aridum TaxID=2030 RepID=A0A1W2FVJ4_KIBAR|nr:hypothetical protein [Kibdelosporangium aridum]SMD25969.1 peptide/nickel transport system ATP-binding protein [Kibdelosporangium aridum]
MLVCDEITAALDTVTQAAILDLLKYGPRTGLSVVLIACNLAVAENVADEIRVLADGRLGSEPSAVSSRFD